MATRTESLTFTVSPEQADQTLADLLHQWLAGQTRTRVRKLVALMRIKLNGELWLDDAYRLKQGDRVEVLAYPERVPKLVDPHLAADG
jgi:hypothetical protein